jgi:transcription antitermination factor NusG
MAEIVNTAVIRPFDAHLATGPCVDDLELRWFAAYTCANHEKKVREQLDQRSVESFLPLYETVRRWKDRRMCLQLPLFAGYVFVRMAMVDRLRVLQVPSIVRIVGFNGHLAALPDAEIEGLRNSLARGVRAEPHPFPTIGRRVRVTRGPLAGLQGVVVRRRNKIRFVVSVELIMRSIAVETNASDLEEI